MRQVCLIATWLTAWLLLTLAAGAATFKLTDGKVVTGELLDASANDSGVQIKLGEGQYERVPWASFTQEDLKQFAQNKRLESLVEPFIEITEEDRIKRTEVNIKQPPRLERPPDQSVLGAMFGSGLGLLVLALLYGANLYAAYEIALFRAQNVPLVCGVSALVPVIAPIVFLCIPTRVQPAEATWATAPAEHPEAFNPMQVETAEHPSALRLHHAEAEAAQPALPPTTTFARGQFTFNRRFFETKFPGFFGTVRRDADRDMVLVVKSSRGEFVGQRISRIAANDLHLQVVKGHASEEVMIPFLEVQEVRLKHKDA